MAYPLPTLDQFVAAPAYVPRAPVSTKPEDPYAGLTPEQRAEADRRISMLMKQDELAARPRSAIGEIATGFKRGAMVELPRMAGQALKATGRRATRCMKRGGACRTGASARAAIRGGRE
jgi:hypothetical protein